MHGAGRFCREGDAGGRVAGGRRSRPGAARELIVEARSGHFKSELISKLIIIDIRLEKSLPLVVVLAVTSLAQSTD